MHGGCSNPRHWDAQMRYFAKPHRVVAVDRRGHGRSDAPGRAIRPRKGPERPCEVYWTECSFAAAEQIPLERLIRCSQTPRPYDAYSRCSKLADWPDRCRWPTLPFPLFGNRSARRFDSLGPDVFGARGWRARLG
ncbi:MAG: hypothetical protein JRJ58_21990 [Deltaproteobacteria bacterium]|nr:hypothetical protein [Deltaproteobacteria bacterium]